MSLRATDDCTDDRTALLIADYLEPDPTDPHLAAYRLRGSRLPVRYVADHVTARAYDTRMTAHELGVYHRAVEAALAFCTQYEDVLAPDAPIPAPQIAATEAAPASVPASAAVPVRTALRAIPGWLQFLLLVLLGAASMILGVALAVAAH